MEKKEVTIGSPVTVDGVTLIPLVEVSLGYWRRSGGGSFFGVKQPVAVVVAVSGSARKAFRVSGEEIPLDQLIQEVPAIIKILEKV